MSDLFDIPHKRDKQLDERGGMAEELADCYGPAHARRTDPSTSHRAAAEVTPHTDNIRAEVERWAMGRGPEGFIDEELSVAFDAADSSSYRTRRAELTQAGKIVMSGRQRFNSNMRKCIVWVHRSNTHTTPMPEPRLTIREQLERHANRLDLSAKQMKAEGRTAFAAELVETAELIRTAVAGQGSAQKSSGQGG